MDPEPEQTKSGQPIYRYRPEDRQDFEFVVGNEETITAVTQHIETYIGPAPNVFHELVSDKVHLDLHIVDPSDRYPFWTLVTSGMSDRPMTLPAGAEVPRFAELAVSLPPEWSLKHEDFSNESVYWPIRWLKMLAHLPFEYNTWLGYGHTVPNGDPPKPFVDDTALCCWLVKDPAFDERFRRLIMPDGREVAFFQIVPLYRSEMQCKLDEGTQPLLERFAQLGITDVIQPRRANAAPADEKNSRKNRK